MPGFRQSRLLQALWVLGLVCLLAGSAFAAQKESPAWWRDAQKSAAGDGYGLITSSEIAALIKRGGDFLFLDVRPAYEFKDGHLPNSQNLEFHLGDRLKLDPAKAKALKAMIGPDPDRLVIIYCRSFR